jgi:hypothetical protein
MFRLRLRFGAQSPTVRRGLVNGCRRRATSPRFSASTRTRCFVRFAREQGYRSEELVRIIEDLA